MLEFRRFYAKHLLFIAPQKEQVRAYEAMLTDEYADALESGFALSAWEGVKCVAAAGCVAVYPHRAIAWALFSNDAAPHMLTITRKVRRTMDLLEYKRIEICVNSTFEAGNKFARLIGMQLETPEPLRLHGVFGEDEYLYAKVK